MFKPTLIYIFMINNSFALLNPLGALSVIGSASNLIKGATEVSETVDASSELYSELSPESRLSERADNLSRRIEKLESIMLDSGYTSEEINEYLGSESRSVNGVATTIRHITKGIRLAKKVSKIGKELSGEKDNTNEELLLNEIIISNKEKELDDTERRIQEDIKTRKMLLSVRKYRRSLQGLPDTKFRSEYESFPIRKYVFNHAKNIVTKITPFLISSIFLILIVRTSALLIGMGMASDYGKLIKDSILCGFILLAYPLLVDMVLQFSDRIADATKIDSLVVKKEINYLIGDKDSSFKIPDLPSTLNITLTTIKEFIFTSGMLGFVVVLSVMIALGPLFLFISSMFGLPIGNSLILVSILILSLFPAIWNLVGALGSVVYDSAAPTFTKYITEILLLCAQFLAPFIIVQKLTGISSIPTTVAKPVFRFIKAKVVTT